MVARQGKIASLSNIKELGGHAAIRTRRLLSTRRAHGDRRFVGASHLAQHARVIAANWRPVVRTGLFGTKLGCSLLAGGILALGVFQPVRHRPPVTGEIAHAAIESDIGEQEIGDQVIALRGVIKDSSRPQETDIKPVDVVAAPDSPHAVAAARIRPDASYVVASAEPFAIGWAAVTAPERPAAKPVALKAVKDSIKTWRYQLQSIDPAKIAASSSDLVVIDYSGSRGAFTADEVEQMKRKPDGSRRIVLSYMSIGEAEDYRWYWDNRSPDWLGRENPKWPGNYAVRFWHPGWQQVIFEYTDRILAAGFDGVYLDKVDEYEDMGHKNDMVDFVARIAARAKAAKPEFIVVSQNGDQLIANSKFRKAIDAFAREDLLFGENADGVRNSASSIRESVTRLKKLTAEGKPVFVVEYPRNDAQAKTAQREISKHGFVGLVARRELDALER
jgi:cysteinyl-tRNA synthetase